MSEGVRVRRARRPGADAPAAASGPAHSLPSRAPATAPAAAWAASPAGPALGLGVQRKPAIGAPDDAYEREADAVAARVAGGQAAPVEEISTMVGGAAQRSTVGEDEEEKSIVQRAEDEDLVQRRTEDEDLVQRASGATATPAMQSAAASAVASPGPGQSLPTRTRATLESRMDADLGGVRVHTGPAAEDASARLRARAFTHGPDIWLGRGESPADVSLMAHEVTHVFQQGGVVRRRPRTGAAGAASRSARPARSRQPAPAATRPGAERSTRGAGVVQRLIPQWVLDEVADYARYVPGWTLFTVIIGFNPILGRAVDRNAINLIQGLMELVPFGPLIFDALRERGILQAAFEWVQGELARLDLSLDRVERTLEAAGDDLVSLEGLTDPVGVLERHFGGLYRDVVAFARSVVDQLVDLIREAAIEVAEGLLAENRAWALTRKILGHDPLRDEPVDATPVEILEDFLLLIGKEEHLRQMRERGTLEEAASWVATQIATFLSLIGELHALFDRAWAAIQPESLPDLFSNLQSLAVDVGGFLQRVWDFATTVAARVLELIKNALLGWLASFADDVPGFHLLTVILGRNPFTGAAVPRTAEKLIRGFITLLPGGAAIYAELAQTGAIAGAAQRIEGALETLGISWSFIVGIFRGLWESLSINDLIQPIAAFTRIVDRFGQPIARLFGFVGVVLREMIYLILQMMNFPFDLIGSIVSNAMQAIEDIKRDPIGFLSNMLEAVKLGFANFFENILSHLVGGLADWLFRGLRSAGIEPPQDLSLGSVLDFVLQVLGLGMERLWEKVAERIGPENVERIRGAIDRVVGIWTFIRDVQQRGIAAIWEYIESRITGLWDMVLSTARDWIMERVIIRATQWLLSLLDVTGIMPVINAFQSFFNAIQSAIEYLRDILAIVNDYVTTIAAVARGALQPGAQRLEQGLANAIPIAIGFLANQFGLGNIGEKIQEIVGGLRAMIDQALDWLIDRAVGTVQSLMRTLGFGGGEEEEEEAAPEEATDARDHAAVATRVVEQLSTLDPTSVDYATVRAEAMERAVELEEYWTSRLVPGIGLNVEFAGLNDDKADNDLDFVVEIAPNTTTAAGAVPTGPPPPTGLSPEQAIPIRWFKTLSLYVGEMELPRLGMTIDRHTPTPIPLTIPPDPQMGAIEAGEYAEDDSALYDYSELEYAGPVITLGVPDRYWPRIGKVMQYLPEERGNTVDQIRAVLDRLGLRRQELGVQMDHVQDLQFEGPDIPPNIWPYDSSANMSAGPRQRDQEVDYTDEDGLVKRAKTNELPGRYFKIDDIGI